MKNIKIVSVLIVVFLLSACSLNVKTKGIGANDGGVFVSNDKGDVWRQMPYIPTISGSPGLISNIDIDKMIMDPGDSTAVYLATVKDGLYFTYNIGRGWNKVLSLPGDVAINDLAISQANKCGLFVALENKLYKSDDCGRSFIQTYYDNNQNVMVSAVVVDHYNTSNVYIGTSRGDVLRSLDGGVSWKVIQRLNDGVRKIIINPKDSRSVFVATNKNGVFSFNPSGGASIGELEEFRNQFDGSNWIDYSKELQEFNLGINFKDLIFSPEDESILLATDKVILRSFDGGKSWIRLSLLTPEADSFINALAVNPKNGREIYYVTNTSFYRSYDGGETWTVRQLPTTRIGSSLLIDFNNPEIIYLGIKRLK